MKAKRPTSALPQLAGYYNQQGDFDKAIEAVQQYTHTHAKPNNPEAHQTLATYYWDKAFRDFRLSDKEKMELVQRGIQAVDEALKLKPDYMEAVAYKNLLLRLQGNLTNDLALRARLHGEADELLKRANELRKQKAAGTQ